MTFLWGRFALYYHNSFVVVAMNNGGRGGVDNLNMWLVVVVPMLWCMVCRSTDDDADKTDCYNSCYHNNSPMLSFLDDGETILFNRFYILSANPSSDESLSSINSVCALDIWLAKPDKVKRPSSILFCSSSDVQNYPFLHFGRERVPCEHFGPYFKILLFHLLRPQDYRMRLRLLSSL